MPDNRSIELTFENAGERECYLLLGEIGSGYPNAVRFTITDPGEQEHNVFFRSAASGVAPSRPSPLVVPLLTGSRYTFRAPLSAFRIPGREGADARLDNGKGVPGRLLRAYLHVSPNAFRPYIQQFGLNIFWSGHLATNTAQINTK